jgi:hypothetical protein
MKFDYDSYLNNAMEAHFNGSEMPSCDGVKDCQEPVTHITNRGFVLCAKHAPARNDSYTRARKLAVWEKKLLAEGKPVPSYARTKKPKDDSHA